MILFFYRLLLVLYRLAIRVASWRSEKARKWLVGRKKWQAQLRQKLPNRPVIWFHCASLGEFEQGRPVIEACKAHFPSHAIVLSFFSPSGYEIRKDYPLADVVTYQPLDHPHDSANFIRIIKPKLAVFVKYEYWYYYLKNLKEQSIPAILISAHFHQKNVRFPVKNYLQKVIPLFDRIFVQSEASNSIVKDGFNYKNVTVAGDTRYDRVVQITQNFESIADIAEWINGRKTIICGSVWEADMIYLKELIADSAFENVCWIIAPHELELEPQHYISESVQFYSDFDKNQGDYNSKILWVDTIGLLSRLYFYGDVTYVGGGFGKGIHNILEAITHGKAVLFGTNYHRFQEAVEAIQAGIAFSCKDAQEMKDTFLQVLNDEDYRNQLEISAKHFIHARTGATEQIITYIATQINGKSV